MLATKISRALTQLRVARAAMPAHAARRALATDAAAAAQAAAPRADAQPAPAASAAGVEPVFRARLEEHYYNTLLEDIMVLSYDHTSPAATAEALAASPEWNRSLGEHPLHDIFDVTLPQLPTLPDSQHMATSLLSLENGRPQLRKRRYRKLLYNPIDYTAVPLKVLLRKPPPPPVPPFAPVPSRMPLLKSITLKVWHDGAVTNKNILLSAIMSLQSISGVRADPLFAEKGDASKRIRAGMPLGARAEITGPRMYEFLDKMTQCVMPRIREFKGINPIGDGNGSITITLPDTAIGYFPDIEPHFDMFPRLFDTDVIINTTAKSDWETVLFLSGFQLPFLEERVVEEETIKESDDIWAKVRSAKTREERIALHKLAQEAAKAKK